MYAVSAGSQRSCPEPPQFLNYLNNGPLISDFVARIELKEILAPLVFK